MTIYSTPTAPTDDIADFELSEDDPLTVDTYRALAQKQQELGPVPFETALRLISCMHAKNRGRPFQLDYDMAIVDVVLRALRWYAYDVEQAHTSLVTSWLFRYELYDHDPSASPEKHALMLALTNAYAA